MPKDGASLARYREVVGGAVDILIGRGLPAPGAIVVKQRQDTDRGTFRLSNMLLRHAAEGEELPAIVLKPKSWNKQLVIWISKEGKRSLLDGQGKPREPVGRLLAAGMAVVGVDLLGQGDFSIDGKPWAKARLNKSGRGAWTAYAGYTFGYNYPLFAQRVHDVLSVVSFARNTLGAAKVHLVGLDGAGHWVLAARAQARETVDRAAADTAGFCFAQLTAIDDPDFLPGGAKYLDLPGIAALSAPLPLWLAGETPAALPVVSAAYEAAQAPLNLVRFSGGASQQEPALEWLLRCTVGDVPLLCEVAAKSRRPARRRSLVPFAFPAAGSTRLLRRTRGTPSGGRRLSRHRSPLGLYGRSAATVDRLKLSGGKVYLAINSRWQFPYDMFEMGTAELPERDATPKRFTSGSPMPAGMARPRSSPWCPKRSTTRRSPRLAGPSPRATRAADICCAVGRLHAQRPSALLRQAGAICGPVQVRPRPLANCSTATKTPPSLLRGLTDARYSTQPPISVGRTRTTWPRSLGQCRENQRPPW